MKYLRHGEHRNEPVPSLATSEFPSLADISEPRNTVLVVDDEPMVRELETQVRRFEEDQIEGVGGPRPGAVMEGDRNHMNNQERQLRSLFEFLG
jgi:hypothetical protein